MTPEERIELARRQLARVQVASMDPVDWSDLSLYAFYALENAVVAAAESLGTSWQPSHPKKAELAGALHRDHALPDVSDLLRQLNSLRKSEAYGDIWALPSLDAEDVASAVEGYLDAVGALIGGGG